MGKPILERLAGQLIAQKFVTSVTGSMSDRAKRRLEATAKLTADRLKRKESLPENSGLILNLTWDDKDVSKSRNYTLALEEFKQVNPEAYAQLQEILGKHRDVRRCSLEFGGDITNTIYIDTIRDVLGQGNIQEEYARTFYGHLLRVSEALKKKGGPYSFLLPE